MNKSNYLLYSLENLLHYFQAEDIDDNNCRQKFRENWRRAPSQQLNYQMVQAAQQFISNLNRAKEYDQKENDDIINNSKHFEQLILPKEKLNENIPVEEEIKEEYNEDEKEVKIERSKLYDLEDKCIHIIRPIFSQLNDDSIIITQFMEVLAKQTTEQIIFERSKNSFQSKLNELKTVSEEVKKQEEVINKIVKKNIEKIMQKSNDNKSEDKKMQYYANLYQLCNLFLNKYDKIMKGDNYYNEMKDKIDNLIKCANDWMIKRSNEKNSMINNMNNLSNSQMSGGWQGYGGNPPGF